MKIILAFLFILISATTFAQNKVEAPKLAWNGYAQARVSSNFDDNTSVMLRRLKFWIHSTPSFSEHWSYKVQVLFTSWMQERFFLQEAHITYKKALFTFDMGQFVPRYSLQWTQPDFHIAAIERANVINALFPNGTLGIRDLGGQINFHSKNKLFETSLGVFNGYGIMEYRFHNQGYMITHRSAINLPVGENKLKLGYSLQFREAEDLHLKHILPDSVLFTGQDGRFNVFALFKTRFWELQAEYLQANLNGAIANGFYALSTINLNKSQVVVGIEQYKDLIAETNDSPHYRLGYNYLFNNDKIKLFLDNNFQFDHAKLISYYASLQLQIFFN